MGYYLAGDYYMAGDPGLFSFLGKAVKGIAGTALGIGSTVLRASPIGQAVTTGMRFARGAQAPAFGEGTLPQIARTAARLPMMGPAAAFGAATGAVKGAAGVFREKKDGGVTDRRRPRMNPMNPRALARASRRIDGMRKGMTKALRHTNYKIVSKSAGRSRGGSRGVITRSEAARALRG